MKLLALTCPDCTEHLSPGNDDLVTLCPRCQRSYYLDDRGLMSIKIQFALAGKQAPNDSWVPFWLFNGKVTLRERQTQGGGSSSGRAAEELWSQTRQFYIPAWDLPLEQAKGIGARLVESQPQLQLIEQPEQVKLIPAILPPDGALKMIDFIVLTIEARRKDWLKKLDFHVQADKPRLFALPAQQIGR